jgi:hypothetical protein
VNYPYIRGVKKNICCLVLFVLCFSAVDAQNIKDSTLRISMIGFRFSADIPLAELEKRYGFNMSVGSSFHYKFKNNWIVGIEGTYFFGNKIKEDVLLSLKNDQGTITNADGNIGNYRLNQRGMTFYAVVGKILPFLTKNKNSGPIVSVGLGYMQHKVHIYDIGRNLPQIQKTEGFDLRKGYDRLTGGISSSLYVGYFYLSNNRLANFTAGIEMCYAYTKGLRGYQYDLMKSDNTYRNDAKIGLRIGWMLPLYKRLAKDIYYYN